ncbi:MAG: hypothetical protein M1836_003074 [Candelina mexicana]|nr:MAG: hypothetical protein M1836_003074 [Candelina mexicana]
MASSNPEPRSLTPNAGVTSSGQDAAFHGNNIAGRDIIIIQSTAELARKLHGSCVTSCGPSNQLASYIPSMVDALDDAKEWTSEASSDDNQHRKLMDAVTGCNDVLQSIQKSSQEHDNPLDIRRQEFAALKGDLVACFDQLTLLDDGTAFKRLKDVIQQVLVQTRRKERKGSTNSSRMHLDLDQRHEADELLFSAAANGDEDAVELQLEHGADIEARDEQRRTPLKLAAHEGHLGAVRMLLEHEPYLEARDDYEQTALLRCDACFKSSASLLQHTHSISDKYMHYQKKTRDLRCLERVYI